MSAAAAAAAAAAAGGASWQEAFEAASAADALSQLLDAAVEKMTDLTTPFSLPLDATIKLCREKRAAVGREGWTAEVAVKFGVLLKLIRDPPAPAPLCLAPVLRGHAEAVVSVAFSPNGQHIVSGSSDMTVRVWDAETGQSTLTMQGHTSAVMSVAYSPNGQHIASGSYDETVRVWDAETGQSLLTMHGHGSGVASVA